MLVLWVHDSEKKINLDNRNSCKLAVTAREWLKARGVSGAEDIEFVDTPGLLI